MATCFSSPNIRNKDISRPAGIAAIPPLGVEVGVLTGGFDRPYVFGLTMALAAKGVPLDVIGSKEMG